MLLEERVARRNRFIEALVALLMEDGAFVAAWLSGSIARGADDAGSDVDVAIVVTDEAAQTFCARPRQLAGYTTPDRSAFFALFGEPAIIHENQNNAPDGGSFTCVVYTSLLTVDWVFVPHTGATRPAGTHLLFEKAPIPLEVIPPLSVAERANRASERVAFFWMMITIGVKLLRRGDAVRMHQQLAGLEPLIAEVRVLLAGAPFVYPTTSSFQLATTVDEQIALVRCMCDDVLALSPAILVLGGYLQERPMAVVEVLLSLPGASTEPDRSTER